MDDHEVRHGRRRDGRRRRRWRSPQLGLPVQVTTYARLAENMVSGALDAARRRAHDLRRHDRRGAQHRRRGPAGARRRAGPRRGAEARHDRRRRDPDRSHGDGARRPRSSAVFGERRRSSAAVIEAGRESGEKHWPMPIPPDIVERVHGSKIADLAQHDWVRWGGGAVGRGVPAGVHRRPALGPPRHRRPGLQHRRRPTVTSPPAAPASRLTTLVDYARRSLSGASVASAG